MRVFYSQKYLAVFSLHICILSAHIVCHDVWYQVLLIKGVGDEWLVLVFRLKHLQEECLLPCLCPLLDTNPFCFPYLPHFPTCPASSPRPPHQGCLPFLPLFSFYLIRPEMSLCCSLHLCEPTETSIWVLCYKQRMKEQFCWRGEGRARVSREAWDTEQS